MQPFHMQTHTHTAPPNSASPYLGIRPCCRSCATDTTDMGGSAKGAWVCSARRMARRAAASEPIATCGQQGCLGSSSFLQA